MKTIGIIVMCIGALGIISLLMEGDIKTALVGGGLLVVVGLALVKRGNNRSE